MRVRNTAKTANLCINIAIALIMLSFTATAIGIAPSKRNFDFLPGQTVTYDIEIVNNAKEILDVIVYARGDLSKNVKISPQMLNLIETDQSKKVTIELTMPDKIETAGEHPIEIVAVGTTPTTGSENAIVKADLAVISQLIIDVPYPDKYAEARIYVLDTEFGKPINIDIPVFNKGKKKIDSASVKIEIYDLSGKLIDSISTETASIGAGDNHKFSAASDKQYDSGDYKAVATLSYDGVELKTETTFTIGELNIEIKSLVVNEFVLGEVAKFDILLYNAWGTELKNVYAEMQITDPAGKEYTNFKTVATDIQSHQIGALEGYWYTKNVLPGVYNARIILHYANKMSQKMFELEVYTNKIVAREMMIGRAISAPDELDIQNNSYLILIVLALLAVIGVLIFKLKKQKGDKQQPTTQPPAQNG